MSVNHPRTFNDRHPDFSAKHSHLYIVKDRGEISDWKYEITHWLSPINFYIYFWQLVRLRNRFFTRHAFFKTAFTLPHFNKLWNTICKGSFAYNTFLFRKSPFSKNYNSTFLADLTSLALLFGDEFVDGICTETGKTKMQELLKENGNNFYLLINKNRSGYPELEYSFDLYKLIPVSLWQIKNEKYDISYGEFYELLKDLLDVMNHRLKKMNCSSAEKAAIKIKEVCDYCFDMFIHDVKDTPIQLQHKGVNPPTAWHEKKSRSIQLKLLELRCILFNRSINYFEKTFNGWLDIISAVQVYDDMQDCRSDDHFQDNLLLAFASGNFPEEMEWFHENKKIFFDDKQWRMQISIHMPCSTYLCTKFTKDKMTGNMNWAQKKICNYLWRNNWFNSALDFEKRNDLENENRLYEIVDKTFPVYELTGSETEWKSYVLEVAFHDKQLKNYILSKVNWLKKYFLLCNFIQMSSFEKTDLIKKIFLPEAKKAS